MKNKKGFTLVEILAVIVVLAILIIIIVPNILKMYNKARKEVFLTSVKNVAKEAERQYLTGYIKGTPPTLINSKDNTKLDMEGNELDYCIVLDANGKVSSMKVSNGKWIANVEGTTFESLKIEDLEEGNLDEYTCGSSMADNSPEPIYCTFEGNLVQGAEYINGQYTYRYMQEAAYEEWSSYIQIPEDNQYAYNGMQKMIYRVNEEPLEVKYADGLYNNEYNIKFMGAWNNITLDGWGVQLTDKESTNPVTTPLCTYINNKPVVSTSYMFYHSKATSIELSTFNTNNVENMSSMFLESKATTLDLSTFNTSNVTDMSSMFAISQAVSIDLSSFNTSNVTNMVAMFNYSNATTLDLSSFDTSKVENMSYMFNSSKATTLNLSTFNTSNVTDMSVMFTDAQATSLNLSSFDTSKVENMMGMFGGTKSITLDLSSFDTSNVIDMGYMFYQSQATTGYARTQADANKFNVSSGKPAGLNFIVK